LPGYAKTKRTEVYTNYEQKFTHVVCGLGLTEFMEASLFTFRDCIPVHLCVKQIATFDGH